MANLTDDFFLCRSTGARAAVSCIAVRISLRIDHTIGRRDALPVVSYMTGFSVHMKKAESKSPRRASKDTRKRNICCLARGPKCDGRDCNRQAKHTKTWTKLPERAQQASLTQAGPNGNTRELAGSPQADSQNHTHCAPWQAPARLSCDLAPSSGCALPTPATTLSPRPTAPAQLSPDPCL